RMADSSFKSKVDWWVALILAAAPISVLAVLLALPSGQGWAGWLSLGLVAAIYGGLVFPMRYVLTADALIIRFGLIRARIAYDDIRRVVPTRNPISSPALSLDRLHIDAGSPLGPNISPANKAEFLRELVARASHLTLDGDSALPTDQE
ncbi:MAG: hypothetical protein ACI9OJ_003508, partial [Myxococcota bacterium]